MVLRWCKRTRQSNRSASATIRSRDDERALEVIDHAQEGSRCRIRLGETEVLHAGDVVDLEIRHRV